MEESERGSDEGSLRSITRGASVFVVGKGLYDVVEFALTLLLTRWLGASRYGIYAFGRTIVEVCAIFTNLGSDKALMRYLPEYADDPNRRDATVGMAYATSLVGGGIVGAALFLSAPAVTALTLDEPLLTPVLRVFAGVLVLETMIRIVSYTFRALERPEYDVLLSKVAYPTIRLAGVAAALVLGYSLLGAMAAIGLSAIAGTLIAASLFLARTDLEPAPPASTGAAAEYYGFSIPLTVKDAGSFLYNRVDVLMVGFFLSATAVGVYNVAVLVATLIALPLQAFNQLFPPVAASLQSRGERDELEAVFTTVTRWTFTCSLVLATGAVVYAPEILGLFGPEFVAGTTVLSLFVLAQLVNNAAGPSGFVLMMTDHQYLLVVNQWTFGVANVVLNYVFILRYGLVGAAMATAAVLAALNVVRVLEVRYLEGMTPYARSFTKPIVAGTAGAAVMLLSRELLSGLPLVFVGGATGVLAVALVLLVLGIEDEDRELFAAALERAMSRDDT